MTKKVLVIGLDAAIPSLIQKYFALNKLPNMKTLVNEGTWAEGIPVFPTHTASNWSSIATGAWPTTHGITDMVMHLPGTPLTEIKSGFYSDLCKAEQIWVTCERFDKKCILVKYIGSWPPNIKNSIQVEGFGAPGGPSARPWGSSPLALSNSSCFSTMSLENANVVNFREAKIKEWNLVNYDNRSRSMLSYLPEMETEIKVGPFDASISYNVLLLASSSKDKYDKAIIAKNRDLTEGFVLMEGQISKWIFEDFENEGKPTKASYRMKLIEIGVDNSNKEKFKLFVSQVYPLEGWTFPKSVARELIDRFGPFLESISHFPYVFGWIDENTYLDDVSYQANWMGEVSKYLISNYAWDLYMTQWHGIDNIQHAFLRFDKSIMTQHEADLCDKVVLRSYQIADDLVGHIIQAKKAKEKSEDEIYTFVLSDHGQVMGKRRFFINGYLYQKGLIKLKRDVATRKISIDWKKTQAFAQGMVHLYVNLKGRDPEGIVQPGNEYDTLVEQIIDVLYDVKDPTSGLRPISLALSNKGAEFLGLSGERAGDVIVAANSVYVLDNRVKITEPLFEDVKVAFPDGSIHGAQLPSLDMGQQGTIKSMFIVHGPNVKKGYIRKKPIHAVDIAPTISYILNIPAPKDSEGAIIYDLFE